MVKSCWAKRDRCVVSKNMKKLFSFRSFKSHSFSLYTPSSIRKNHTLEGARNKLVVNFVCHLIDAGWCTVKKPCLDERKMIQKLVVNPSRVHNSRKTLFFVYKFVRFLTIKFLWSYEGFWQLTRVNETYLSLVIRSKLYLSHRDAPCCLFFFDNINIAP